MTFYFNPRSREGSDHGHGLQCLVNTQFQSTLPRRERLATETLTANKADFNPRSREGSDLTTPVLISREQKFQSTLPRRERLHLHTQYLQCYKFQSTLPRRERLVLGRILVLEPGISIHAPAKGATKRMSKSRCSKTFQSTLPRRERRQERIIPPASGNFNPRSREGSDR